MKPTSEAKDITADELEARLRRLLFSVMRGYHDGERDEIVDCIRKAHAHVMIARAREVLR